MSNKSSLLKALGIYLIAGIFFQMIFYSTGLLWNPMVYIHILGWPIFVLILAVRAATMIVGALFIAAIVGSYFLFRRFFRKKTG